MDTKKLAKLIKEMRKQKLDEYQVRAGGTHPLQDKTPDSRGYKSGNQPKGGADTTKRYKSGIKYAVEDKIETKKQNTIINTKPEQNSVLIGTQ